MNKQEMVAYLIDLNGLLEAQEDNGVEKSTLIAWEYERVFAEFKQGLQKEKEDEARNRGLSTGRPEEGANPSRDQPKGSGADRSGPSSTSNLTIRRSGV